MYVVIESPGVPEQVTGILRQAQSFYFVSSPPFSPSFSLPSLPLPSSHHLLSALLYTYLVTSIHKL